MVLFITEIHAVKILVLRTKNFSLNMTFEHFGSNVYLNEFYLKVKL